jgi:hypothetical protein
MVETAYQRERQIERQEGRKEGEGIDRRREGQSGRGVDTGMERQIDAMTYQRDVDKQDSKIIKWGKELTLRGKDRRSEGQEKATIDRTASITVEQQRDNKREKLTDKSQRRPDHRVLKTQISRTSVQEVDTVITKNNSIGVTSRKRVSPTVAFCNTTSTDNAIPTTTTTTTATTTTNTTTTTTTTTITTTTVTNTTTTTTNATTTCIKTTTFPTTSNSTTTPIIFTKYGNTNTFAIASCTTIPMTFTNTSTDINTTEAETEAKLQNDNKRELDSRIGQQVKTMRVGQEDKTMRVKGNRSIITQTSRLSCNQSLEGIGSSMNEQREDLFERGRNRQTDTSRQRQREKQKGYRVESHRGTQECRGKGDTLKRETGKHIVKRLNEQAEGQAGRQSDRQRTSDQRQRERMESWQVIRSQDSVQGMEQHGLRQGRWANSREVNGESYQRKRDETHTQKEGHSRIREENEAEECGDRRCGGRPNVGKDKAWEDQGCRTGQHSQTRHRVRWWDIH